MVVEGAVAGGRNCGMILALMLVKTCVLAEGMGA
jgi:hypothetical protein